MNFFRKKDKIFASFKKEELLSSHEKLRSNLLSLQPVPVNTDVRLNVGEAEVVSLQSLACIFSFARLMHESGVSITLEGAPEVVDQLQRLGMNAFIDAMQKEVKIDVG